MPQVKNSNSPFLDVTSFPRKESETSEGITVVPAMHPSSPFVSVYEMEGAEGRVDPESEEFIQFLGELNDDEFDNAVFEIMSEASILYEDHFSHRDRKGTTGTREAEQFLAEHFAPLERELDMLLDTMINDLHHRDLEVMTDVEIDSFVDSHQFASELSPKFENWGGWLKKKLKKAAKWAKKKAKKLAAKAFQKAVKGIKRYLPTILKKILTFAIGKLPKKYQGMANVLRKKLGYEIEDEAMVEEEQATIGDIDQIQRELDLFIANVLYNQDEIQNELLLAEVIHESEQSMTDSISDLEIAREQFIEGILDLKEGEDPTPLVENFLPAIMWAVKIGLKFYGRPKLVNFLAKFLAKLILKYVGRQYALPLSKVIVSAGLRLVNLEATEQEAIRAAGGAVASLVEDTIADVATLPEYILDDEELLEGFVLEAFEKAATRNLPEILSKETYVKRPSLRESKGLNGMWTRKFRGRKKTYKKFTRPIKTKLSYHKLRAIKSFAGTPLSEILSNQLGHDAGFDLEATVHLFEATLGDTLPQISRNEMNTPGLGSPEDYVYSQIHPLTPVTAGILFGQPGLGRAMPIKYLINRRTIGVGQRFYYLEIPGAKLQMSPIRGASAMLMRGGSGKLTLDFPRHQIRFCLFLSESDAQNISMKLRQKLPVGSVMTLLRSMLNSSLPSVLSANATGQIKIIHEAIPPQLSRRALSELAQPVKSKLMMRLQDWLGKGLSNFFREQPQGFIHATEKPADGVTLNIILDNPPDFTLLQKSLKGRSVSQKDLDFLGDVSATQIKAISGYYNE